MNFKKGIHLSLLAFVSLMFLVQIANAGWQYKRSISISYTGTALTNYQALVTLTTSNFNYNNAKSDGSDIRFSTDATGSSLPDIDYWIETWNTSGDSKIWVEVPSIPASGGTTIYMYYGNASASAASDGDATFEFFDDFDGSSIDASKWTVTSSGGDYVATVSGGELHQYALSGNHYIRTDPVPLTNNIIVQHKMKIGTYADAASKNRNRCPIGGTTITADHGIFDDYRGGGRPTTISYFWSSWTSPITSTTLDTWLSNVHKLHGSTFEWAVSIYSTGVLEYSKSVTTTFTEPLKVGVGVGDGGSTQWGGDIYTDWVFVRKYASPEPSASVGSEESASDASLPVELSTFTATSSDGKVTLHWRTESEVENLGFNLYRSESPDGPFVQVNEFMVPGAGNSAIPHDYDFTDQGVAAGRRYFYAIEDVDLNGVKTRSHLIEVLVVPPERIVSKVLPKAFALFQNFPNPFNPETWIPYQLAESASVEIRIYDSKGKLVRKISLGEKDAGYYKTKETAAHWDGRDDLGQPVASGVYFYQLKAGDFMKARKMVIVK